MEHGLRVALQAELNVKDAHNLVGPLLVTMLSRDISLPEALDLHADSFEPYPSPPTHYEPIAEEESDSDAPSDACCRICLDSTGTMIAPCKYALPRSPRGPPPASTRFDEEVGLA
jgi:hypothetical protein